MSGLLPGLVGEEQVGFVAGREGRHNISRVIHAITHAIKSKSPLVLLGTDAEKAFDRVSWAYMEKVLQAFGFPEGLIRAIYTLYSAPSARVLVNGTLSNAFQIRNGTRQGCPLSPTLFVLTLETLLLKFRQSPTIKGVKLGRFTAPDDLLLLLSNPEEALLEVMQIFETFGVISNFKINFDKSEALGVSLPAVLRTKVKALTPFKWPTQAIKYLGVTIPMDPKLLFSLNFPPLLSKVTSILSKSSSPFLTWLGRKNVLTTYILPLIMYTLRALPISVPVSFINKLQSIMSSYLWDKKRTRMSFRLLSRRKKHGGISLPDLSTYIQAISLERWLKLARQETFCMHVDLELALLGKELFHRLWTPERTGEGTKVDSVLTRGMLHICHKSLVLTSAQDKISPLAPISVIPTLLFPQIKSPSDIWLSMSHHRLGDLKGLQITSDFYTALSGVPALGKDFIQRNDFENACRQFMISKFTPLPDPSWLENYVLLPNLPHKCTTLIYRQILSESYSSVPPWVAEWGKELHLEFSDTDSKWIQKSSHGFSKCIKIQENSVKTALRWYRTPEFLFFKFQKRFQTLRF